MPGPNSAVVLRSWPSLPNATNTDLLYTITSSNAYEPQFKYLCEIQDETGSILTTIRQSPNQWGIGVFDLLHVLDDYMGYDKPFNLIANYQDSGSGLPYPGYQYYQLAETSSNQNIRQFNVVFGEEYGTSQSSSVTVYGPDKSQSLAENQIFIPATVPFYSGSYDFYQAFKTSNPFAKGSGSFLSMYPSVDSGSWAYSQNRIPVPPTAPEYRDFAYYQDRLIPVQYISGAIDYHSMTLWNARQFGYNYQSNIAFYGYPTGSWGMFMQFYSSSGLQVFTLSYNPSYSLAPNLTNSYAEIDTQMVHFGVGPLNVKDYYVSNSGAPLYASGTIEDIFFKSSSDYPYYTAFTYTTSSNFSTGNPGGDGEAIYLFELKTCNKYEGVRFAFINEFGVMDYIRATQPKKISETFNRKTYRKPYIDYSTDYAAGYDQTERGETQYWNRIDQKYEVDTNWLTKAEASYWLQLFESPEVYVQDGDSFRAVVIENVNESYYTDDYYNFQYTIRYRYANQKRPRQL